MRFAKGHGTGNDFLILPDPDDRLELPADLVARLCDRRNGLGADGILRAVRAGVGTGTGAGTGAGTVASPDWFMDYRNADGSIAEMCGNGIRVFARYLLDHGLADGQELVVQTRAGPRWVRAEPGGDITVDMGAARLGGSAVATIGGIRCQGRQVWVGNPHLACMVTSPVAAFDLSRSPAVDRRRFPDGVNVEVARIVAAGHLEMRVHERGSGATLSCGTGAVAAASAAASSAAVSSATPGAASRWIVDVPGGRLVVTLGAQTCLLTGPAVLVAEGEVNEAWLAGSLAAAPATA